MPTITISEFLDEADADMDDGTWTSTKESTKVRKVILALPF